MFEKSVPTSIFGSIVSTLQLVYTCTVYNVRKAHGNAAMALFVSIAQTAILMMVFVLAREFLGMRMPLIRGEFFIYMLTGIYLFMVHLKTVMAVAKADGPTSPLMQHAPMNTLVSIISASLGALYTQILTVAIMLLGFHVFVRPFEIYDPIGCLRMVLLAWYLGVCVGILFWGLRAIAPTLATMLQSIYQRINMIASGKMFVANTLPPSMLAIFSWNPLFHIIDQSRGYAFVNYVPRNSDASYAFKVATALVVIGLMCEFYTRKFTAGTLSS